MATTRQGAVHAAASLTLINESFHETFHVGARICHTAKRLKYNAHMLANSLIILKGSRQSFIKMPSKASFSSSADAVHRASLRAFDGGEIIYSPILLLIDWDALFAIFILDLID